MGGTIEYLYLISEYVIKQHKINENTPHEVVEMNPIDLLVPERLDIAAKLKFIEAYETGEGIEEAEELYKKHIEAFTDGHFIEYGNRQKNSYEKYRDSFIEIIFSIKNQGFRDDISLIPVGADNIAIGGAHRIACAIYFKKKIRVVKFSHIKTPFDFLYFRDHLLEEKYIIKMVEEYVKYKDNNYVVFLWPKGYKMRSLIFEELAKINAKTVYKKKFQIEYDSYWALIKKIYRDEEWLGTEKDSFIGVTQKALFSYEPHGNMMCLIVGGIDSKQILDFKTTVREKIGQQKRSLHTTDNKEETLEIIPMLLDIENNKSMILKGKFYYVKKKIRFLYMKFLIFAKKTLGYPI